jgi:hypothetical protein
VVAKRAFVFEAAELRVALSGKFFAYWQDVVVGDALDEFNRKLGDMALWPFAEAIAGAQSVESWQSVEVGL